MKRPLLTLTALTLVACSTNEPATSPPPAAHAPSSGADAPSAKGDAPELPPGKDVSMTTEVLRMAKVRELPQRGEVRGREVQTGALLAHVKATFRRELPPHVLAATGDMLIALGAAPTDFDFEQAMLSLLESQLAGLYDPRLDAMLIRESLSEAERAATLDHELVHALQDQNYDLNEVGSYEPDKTDESSALSALAEGDATSAMTDAILANARNPGAPVQRATDLPDEVFIAQMATASETATTSENVPAIVRRSLVAPYVDGLLFVHALRRRGGWKAVDAAWNSRPTSTEQILHIDKYLAREPAIVVEVPAPPPAASGEAAYSLLLSDVWGEQSLRLLFEEWMPPRAARTAASGWGGDRIVIYARGEERALAWHIVADDEPTAKGMLEALRRAPIEQSQGTLAGVSWWCQERPEVGPLAIARSGKSLHLVTAPRAGNCTTLKPWLAQLLGAPSGGH